MAVDLNAYLESEKLREAQEASEVEPAIDLEKYLAEERGRYYREVFTDEPTVFEKLERGIIGEIGAINDTVAALGEIIGNAAGTLGTTALASLFVKANLAGETDRIEKKIEDGTVTLDELIDHQKVKKDSTFKSVATASKKETSDITPWLNPTKYSDVTMDYLAKNAGLEDQYKLVKEDLQNLKDKSAVGRAMAWLGEHIDVFSKQVESDVGVPSEVAMAITELLMLKTNTIAKPLVSLSGSISKGTGVTGTIKRVTGNSDLAQINKAMESRSKLGYDSKHLQEYKNAATFGKITQTDKGISFDLPPENFVKEMLQDPTFKEFGKQTRKTKTEKDAVEINELAGRGQQKLDNTYTTLITNSLTTQLNKVFGKKREQHIQVYDNIVDYITWDSTMKSSRPKLNKLEKDVYKKVFEPGLKEYNRLIKKLKKEGKLERDIIIDSSKTGKFFPRRKLQSREGFLKNVLGDKFKINDPFGRRPTVAASASSRQYFTLYNPITRQRQVIALDQNLNQKGGTTNVILRATRNKRGEKVMVKDRALTELNTVKPITKSGEKLGSFEVREATRKELRDSTNLEYVQESPTVLFDRIAELRQIERDLTFEKNFKLSPYFKENAIKLKSGEILPEGFKKVTEDLTRSYKGLDKYYYKDRAAEILEDANRPRPKNILTKVSDALVKNMMLNPLPHMHNELIHFYSTKGFMRSWSPEARALFKEDIMWAENQVKEFGPAYREALKNNSSMMSTNIKNTTALDLIFRKNHKDFYAEPNRPGATMFQRVDKLLNRRVGETYGKVSNNSQNAMWHTRDVMFMMLIKQKQRTYPNLSMKQHIELVESHLPSYRIPIRVGEKLLGAKLSRGLSKILQNQSMVIFARYKHGMVSSGLNTVRDLLAPFEAPLRNLGTIDPKTQKKSAGKIVGTALADFIDARGMAKGRKVKEQFKDGVDSGLALASASFIIYPILDSIFQEIFNSDEGHLRRAGILHVLDTAIKVKEGSKEPYSLFQNLATINPTFMIGTELVLNQTFYNGRKIYNWDDPVHYMTRDILKKLGTSVPLASQFVNADGANEKVLARQFDFKVKSEEQAAFERKQERNRKKALRTRERLRELDLDEDS